MASSGCGVDKGATTAKANQKSFYKEAAIN